MCPQFIRFPEINKIDINNTIIAIELCYNSNPKQFNTRHNPIKYHEMADKIINTINISYPNIRILTKILP